MVAQIRTYIEWAGSFAARKPAFFYGIAALVLVGGWIVFFRGGAPLPETYTVVREDLIEQVSVSGEVVPAQEVDLGFAQSGRVAGVYAKVGDRVPAGAVLANIENGELRAAILQKEAALEVEKAELASFKAGTRDEDLAASRNALSSAIVSGYISADDAVRNQADQFIQNPLTASPIFTPAGPDFVLINNLIQARIALEMRLTAWQKDLPSGDVSSSSNLIAQALSAESQLREVLTFLDLAAQALAKAVPGQYVSLATLQSYQADIAAARTDVSAALTSIVAKRGDVAIKEAGSSNEDIAAQEAQVKAAEANVASARAEVQKTLVVAPFSGIVTRMDAKVGSIVSPADLKIALISSGALQLESYVPEISVANMKVGNPATATLDAYGSDVVFEARVVSIDPAQTKRDGVSTYKAVLQLVTTDVRVRPGMTANVVVTTDRKEQVLAVPVGAVVVRDGKKFVTVFNADTRIEREVTTGTVSSLGTVELVSGVSEGEVVLLQPK